jgi:hypothetical protein
MLMSRRQIYVSIRDLHLYVGLFVSPFVLLFSTSVFVLNHGKFGEPQWSSRATVAGLHIPDDLEQLQGREAVERVRELLPQIGLDGEIGFLRLLRKDRHVVFPVSKPGVEANVDLDLAARSAVISRRQTGWAETLVYLHKSPGPHNVAIRGNWAGTRVWRWLADTTIYSILFVSITGVYLWYAIKAERAVGVWLLGAGAVAFAGMIYAVIS